MQLTPPGSACSIAIGVGVADTAAGSIQGLHLVVDDIHTARKELIKRGVDVGGVQDMIVPRQARSLLRTLHRPGRQWLDPSETAY